MAVIKIKIKLFWQICSHPHKKFDETNINIKAQ